MASTGKSSFVGDLFKDVKASVKGSIGNFIGQKAQGTPLEGLISKFTEKGTPGAVGGKGMDGPINKFTAAVNTFTKAVDGKGSSGGDVSTLGLAKKEEIVENASAIDKLTASMDSATESAKIFKETCEIDWTKSAKQVYDFVRGLSPVPGAWTTLVTPDGKETVLKIYKARKTGVGSSAVGTLSVEGKSLYIAAQDELLEIVELQLAGKKRMAARDFLNGMKNPDLCHVK